MKMARKRPLWRTGAMVACDLALGWIGLSVTVMLLVAVLAWESEESCRRQWRRIEDYPVLADVCKNEEARAALGLANAADRIARYNDGSLR